MTNPNDPAFNDESNMSIGGHVHDQGYKNLTKREYFAAMAMGAAMQYASGDGRYNMKAEDFAKSAIAYADALIKELSK